MKKFLEVLVTTIVKILVVYVLIGLIKLAINIFIAIVKAVWNELFKKSK